jgi:myosin-5
MRYLTHIRGNWLLKGILEAIRISREAYPNRTLHADVVRRYSICFGKSMQATGSAQETATHMVQTLLSESQYQVGKTKVFFKRDGLEAMETRRTQVLHQLCVHIQSSTRRFLAMKSWKNTKAASAFIQRITRGMLARMRAKQESAAVVLQAVLRCNSQRCQHRVICSGALALQCLYRAILARAALSTRKLGLAAMRIQSRVRGRSACRHYRMLLLAVVILQAYGRRHIHVRRYVEIRDTAREDAMLCNQVNKLSRLLAEEREKRLALEAQNADLVSQTGA